MPDRVRGLAEMARVTGRRAGRVLELSEPRGRCWGPLARFHVHRACAAAGRALSGGEYRYLQTSIAAFPPPHMVMDMMSRSGLEPLSAQPLGFGACHLFVGKRLTGSSRTIRHRSGEGTDPEGRQPC